MTAPVRTRTRGVLDRLLVAAGLFVAAHFCLSYVIPADAGEWGWLVFPFGRVDAVTSWTFGPIDGLPLVVMLVLASTAVLMFTGAFLATFGWRFSAETWRTLVLIGVGCSVALFVLHLGPWAIAPLALDGVLGWVAGRRIWQPAPIHSPEARRT